MGVLVDGAWRAGGFDPKMDGGRFVRHESAFRDWIRADGTTPFAPERGRYHLYVSLACPWAHRTLIFRKLKRLDSIIGVTVVDPIMLDHGWVFAQPEPLHGKSYLYEIYQAARADFTGRVTVPVLWDDKLGTIVNNESSEIIRMLNSAFDAIDGVAPDDYYPAELRDDIDAINARVYDSINNGVYKCGFAGTQEAYEEAFEALFAALDEIEQRLSKRRYLCGDRLTEADWRLFTTLVRFDPVYVTHFKCNRRRLIDYPKLWAYTRRLYQHPGVAETVDFHHIKQHYFRSHESLNPKGIVPLGPDVDFSAR